ncbi:uncharacterized protein METZ01_LOCUS435587, partial [marine metagenome]
IFADKRPFAQCHASTLVQFADDTFLAAWFGGSKESNADVGIWGADYQQGQWSTPRQLAKTRDDAHWNPVLHVDQDGASIYSSRSALLFPIGKPGWSNRMTAANTGPSRASW